MENPLLAIVIAGFGGFGLGLGVVIGAAIVRKLRQDAGGPTDREGNEG